MAHLPGELVAVALHSIPYPFRFFPYFDFFRFPFILSFFLSFFLSFSGHPFSFTSSLFSCFFLFLLFVRLSGCLA